MHLNSSRMIGNVKLRLRYDPEKSILAIPGDKLKRFLKTFVLLLLLETTPKVGREFLGRRLNNAVLS